MTIKNIGRLIISILLCQAAGIIGSVFTAPSIATWYATLQKPAFTPPGWVFAPVWLTLYTLMGIAFYRVWIKSANQKQAKLAMAVFGVHLVLNALWSIIFFGLHNIWLALVVIAALWLMIAWIIRLFSRLDKAAAWLLVPYIAWVTVATALNFSIWRLNG